MHRFLTMPKFSARNVGVAACSAMAAVLFAGGMTNPQSADAATAREEVAKSAQDAVARAEARVAKAPRNGAYRVDLAQAYFAQGRFASAATTLEDAEKLGDVNPRLVLGLVLAYIGSDRQAAALDMLAKWRMQIPASDFGLALALAGHPDQGVAILTDAVRAGDANAKTRQNLAYAYALSGRWAEARLIAAQDVPAGQLDARLADWASTAHPSLHRERIAALLGTPLGIDPGQPTALALYAPASTAAPVARLAVAEPAAFTAPVLAEVTPSGELAPIQRSETSEVGETFWGATQAAEEAPPAPQGEVVDDWRMASAPTAAIPESTAAPQAPAFVRQPKAKPVPVAARTVADSFGEIRPSGPRHLVQLGSFKTRAGAERAWRIFQSRDPRLKNHTLRITEADVAGQRYYRVAAEGFDRSSAATLCSKLKQRGDTCLAYAEGRKLPGAVPGPARQAGGRQLASR